MGHVKLKPTKPDRIKMDRKNISSGSPLEKPIGFSRACRVGNIIAVAGTAPIGKDGSTVGIDNVYEQTKHCLEITKRAIEEAGGTLKNVIRTRIMLVDMNTWKEAAKTLIALLLRSRASLVRNG